jgi:long-chain acyl-CoA synthetase
MVYAVISSGGCIAFYSGDVLKLKDDIAQVRPTIFASVPRLYNKFYDGIKGNMEKLTGMKRYMADSAVSAKLDNLNKDAAYTHTLWDRLVFKKTKELFGGRVRWMCTGSAPISSEVINFLKVAACCPIFEGYGQTESTGFSYVTSGRDPVSGHVGGPTQCIEVKLVDVPDMKYLSTDKGGPRGEVCFRGPGVFLGYYKDVEKTKEAVDSDGWLHSGDIGQFLPNGALRIIDRKKNIFKLAQGEYVAPEKVENIYLRAKGVAEAFLHGDSLQSYCVAVIVPKKENVMEWALEAKLENLTFEELC